MAELSAGEDAAVDNTPVKDPTAVETQLLEDLIQSVVDSLNHLDQFDPSQMLPQLRERLNQWILQSRRTDTWKLDPLIDTLSPQLASTPVVAQIVKNFDRGLFTMHDMIGLQETIWLRDIAKAARGSQLDDVSVAEQLFDWTVRNLQLVEEPIRANRRRRIRWPKSCCRAGPPPANGPGFFCCCCVSRGSTA